MRSRASRSPSVDRRHRGRGGGGESVALGCGQGGWGEKGERWRPAPFMVARGCDRVGRRRGVRGSAPHGVENREERGGPRRGGGWLGRSASAPDQWEGRRSHRVTGEGGGARAANRHDRVTSGPSGQRLGAGGSERERGNVTRGADRWARLHSAGRFDFKPIQTKSKYSKRFKQIQNSPNID
jgi:hypothetical protein